MKRTKSYILGGFAAYLIFKKGINVAGKIFHEITEASKWRAYYRALGRIGKANDILPPGYKYISDEEQKRQEASQEALKASITNAIDQTMGVIKDRLEARKTPLEGQTEASESDICEYCKKQKANGVSYSDIAKELNISLTQLFEILYRNGHKDAEETPEIVEESTEDIKVDSPQIFVVKDDEENETMD